jgi:hypothetical protein
MKNQNTSAAQNGNAGFDGNLKWEMIITENS